jgi:hypothetical protein
MKSVVLSLNSRTVEINYLLLERLAQSETSFHWPSVLTVLS